MTAQPPLSVVPPHQDKYIFQMFEALQREFQSIVIEGRARGNPDAELNSDRLGQLCDAIVTTQAQTNAGLAVKARAALMSLMAMALNAGVNMAEDCPPVAILKSVIDNAERLAKAG